MLAAEARRVRELAAAEPALPAHLAGIPSCLHKYEPLFRDRGTPLRPARSDAAA